MRKTNTNNNLLEINLKGLNLYNKSLKSFLSKYNFINLILNVKNNSQTGAAAFGQPVVNSLPALPLQSTDGITVNTGGGRPSIKNKHKQLSLIKYLEKLNLNNNIARTATAFLRIRSGGINYVKNINYNNISSNYSGSCFANTNLYDLLFNSFLAMNSLISKPIFEVTNEKVKIHLFIYLFLNKNSASAFGTDKAPMPVAPSGGGAGQVESFTKLNKIKLDILCQNLSHLFKKPVQLELVRLYYPYFDSNIFVNLLSKLINIIQIRTIMKRFFNKAIIKNPFKIFNNNGGVQSAAIIKIPSLLSGLNIRIGGRLLTQRIIPRKTVKTIKKGTLSKGKINFLDESRYTNKNKRGAYTLVVSIGHYLT